MSLLEVDRLVVRYGRARRRPAALAVDDVSLAVAAGQAVGLVGESGSGKTTIARAVLGLAAPTGGRIRFDGADVTGVPAERRRGVAAHLQVVFQDPYSSLNPTRTVGVSLVEPLGPLSRPDAAAAADRLLRLVGLPAEVADRYPGQFSGGQRQRIAIARALSISPRLVICDEPVSALDLSTQAQILNLLGDLRAELGLAYLFIGHNLAVVRHVCDEIVVLYRGQVMESGPADAVTGTPLHPYTRALVAAAPVPDVAAQRERRRSRAAAAPAATAAAPPTGEGCPFTERCPHAETVCGIRRPVRSVLDADRTAACHMYEPGSGHTRAPRFLPSAPGRQS